jgi:hypothetical protein
MYAAASAVGVVVTFVLVKIDRASKAPASTQTTVELDRSHPLRVFRSGRRVRCDLGLEWTTDRQTAISPPLIMGRAAC